MNEELHQETEGLCLRVVLRPTCEAGQVELAHQDRVGQ